jgi:hypothetical protein
MQILNLRNLKFENAQIIGKQIAELIAKIENPKFQTLSFGSVLKSKSDNEIIELSVKASNEYFQREANKR